MPRSYWCILVAFIGWLTLAAADPKGARSEPQNATQGDVGAALQSIAASLQGANKPNRHDKPCDQGRDDRSSDLCAQWKAADAARDAADYTYWFGWLGTVIGALTLAAATAAAIFAKLAADHTKTGADASESSVKVQREAVALQLRPYVMFTDAVSPAQPLSRDAAIPIDFKNYGQTPAHHVTLRQGSSYRKRPVGNAEVALHATELEDFGTLGPTAEHGCTMSFNEMSKDKLAKVAKGELVLLLRFRLDYKWGNDETDSDDMTLVIDDESWASGSCPRISGQYRRRKK